MIEKNPVMKKKCRILSKIQSLIIKKNWAWYLSGISVQLYNIISLSLLLTAFETRYSKSAQLLQSDCKNRW